MGNVGSHIYTYAEKRSFTGNLEEKSGKCGLTPPNKRFERTRGTSPLAAQPNDSWTLRARRKESFEIIFCRSTIQHCWKNGASGFCVGHACIAPLGSIERPPLWNNMAKRKRARERKPQALDFIFWMLAFVDSAMALVACIVKKMSLERNLTGEVPPKHAYSFFMRTQISILFSSG